MRHVLLPCGQKVERDVERARLQAVHHADEPFVTFAPGRGDVFADLPLQHFRLVPNGRYAVEKFQFRFVAAVRGTVVPVQELQRAVIHHRHSQLLARRGMYRPRFRRERIDHLRVIAVEIAEVVTDRIVGRSRYIAGER